MRLLGIGRRHAVRCSVGLALASTACVLLSPLPASAKQGGTPGLHNDITDVPGVLVGNVTNTSAMTGTTVVYFPAEATAGVDIRSGAPIERETDLTAPTDEVQKVNAFLLTGGGDYGLAAGPGVMTYLEDHDQGFLVGTTPDQVVPIVPGAAINDLGRGGHFSVFPNNSYGYDAIANATTGPIPEGNVGAGTGAIAGGLKSGLGSASVEVQPGIFVGALVVVNSLGTPVDTTSGCGLLGAEYALSVDLTGYRTPPRGCGGYAPPPLPSRGAPGNRGGVIGVVVTNVTIDKAMALKLAQVAQDGITRAVQPAHTMFDGDVMFGASTDTLTPAVGLLPTCIGAEVGGEFGSLGCAVLWLQILDSAEDVTSRAITKAMLAARSVRGFPPSYCAEFPGACPAADSAIAAGAASVGPTTTRVAPARFPGMPLGLGLALILWLVVGLLIVLGWGFRFPRRARAGARVRPARLGWRSS